MQMLSLLALSVTALAVSTTQAIQQSEDIWFNDRNMLLEQDSETQVTTFSVTLQPSETRCDASNCSFPSLEFKCGDNGYSFSLVKIPEFYSRNIIQISHVVGSG